MQLSQLLKRLSVVERAELVKRVGAPATVAKNPQLLAAYISDRYRLASIFLSLDSTALGLLRWAAVQPGHEAAWQALQAEIGDRAPVEQVRRALQELRLWGLADFKATPRDGFVATYGAIAQALKKDRVSLEEYLNRLDTEELRKTCTKLGARNPPTTRAARLQMIVEVLIRSGSASSVIGGLSTAARELFEWMRSSGGNVSPAQMIQRFPGANTSSLRETRYVRRQRQAIELAELMDRCLVIPLSDPSQWYVTAFAIPDEVQYALSKRPFFDEHPLRPPLLEPADARQLSASQPMHLLRDVAHLLGFVSAGRCELRQDGQPYQRSLQTFGKTIQITDRTYPEMLWRLCELAGLLQPASRAAASQAVDVSALGPRGLFWLLVDGWTGSNEGATYYASPVSMARRILLQVLATIPADTWVTRDSLQSYLHFVRPLLFAPPHLVQPSQAHAIEWGMLGHLFLAIGETADGQPAVMIPAGVQSLLADRARGGADVLPQWEVSWHVQPDRTIVAPPNLHPYALMHFWQVAQLEENHGASIFRVTPAAVAAALNRDMEPARVRQILEEGSKTPLPETVIRLLNDQSARYGQITLGPAQAYLRTADPAILDELLHDRKLDGIAIHRLGPDVACIESFGPLAAREALRRAGYLPVIEAPAAPPGPSAASSALASAPARRADARVIRFMRQRVEDGFLTWVKWQEGNRESSAIVEADDIEGASVRVTRQSDGKSFLIGFSSILAARVVEGQADDAYEEQEEQEEEEDLDEEDEQRPW